MSLFAVARALAACAVVGLVLAVGETRAARGEDKSEPDYASELPRIPPVEPAAAVATFQVALGFRVEQVAAEPLVTDPVAMAFDADGRLFVVEMNDYSEDREGRLGVVRLLTDTDGDGRFDQSSVFADKLSWPTAIACYDGGVFVGAAPDVLYLKDRDGDGRAEIVQKIFTGFNRSNVQGLLNTLTWTLDNRIHGATSSSGGEVRRADQPHSKPVALSGRDFEFDPRTLDLRPTSGGAQHGLSFDVWGHKFVCSNSDHIQQVMFEDRYIARNPYLTAPSPRISIAADGAQAEVYRISPVEPWRIVRTRLRVAGAVPGAVEGGGRAAGYFTGATGVTIYRGDAWPENVRGIAVVGDVGGNLIHRKRLERTGLEFVARRIDDKSELVASKDIWFRPAQYANAPDGTLYIADVYREVIEHPDSLPPVIKKHLDLTSGRDRGRIYRIVPEGFQQPKLPKLSSAMTADLVAALGHTNGWRRETASRLIYERQDKSAVAPLEKLSADCPLAEGRMHALYALDGLRALAAKTILRALADADPRVRRHAVRLAERLANESGEVRDKLLAMVADDDLEVRYQLSFTLGEIRDPGRTAALAQIARRDAGDRWIRLALLSSLADGVGDVFDQLASDQQFRASAAGRAMLESLAVQAGLQQRDSDVAAVLKTLPSLTGDERPLAEAIVRGLSDGLARQGGKLSAALAGDPSGQANAIFAKLLASAREAAADGSRKPEERRRAVQTLGLGKFADARDVLAAMLAPQAGQDLQMATLATLARFDDPEVASLVIAAWPALGPRLRTQAVEALLTRADRIAAVLDAIEAGTLGANEIDPARLKLLGSHKDKKIAERAGKLLASAKLGRRQDVVDAHRRVLEMQGDPARGKASFQKTCAACHRVEGVGYEIGANLATIKNRGAEAILVNVLDPNREVNPQYVNYVLVTDDGRTLTGTIAAETATSVTLKRAEGATDTVLRVNIEELTSTGQSIMPEGLEKQLDAQGLADVIAYLMQVK